ncbi:MAG TPA: bifunctional diaminohydroxyphosphoribosylaminopyrimidine deaminase/5-amino-6-(5-phosphoribosylamino)uracil reductase RibD [Bryobacteraceae bacterium]|nr:bifunctional diaminohydroxyphosphoribosylaminopyrimidine deaminase/5-amino-6-(5-phosphoribosylamino)uracil reductase RibD [Bryobacteraceae bacterium]
MPDYMAEALALAERGRGRTSPNPAVGAVLVRDGVAVGRGYHVYAERRHAEIVALNEAGERARGATLFVTLEPCSHEGRTGPCTDAVISAGIAEVVAAMQDPNPLVGGRGFDRLRAAGIRVHLAHEYTAAAEKLNEAYVHFMSTGLPLVTMKSAVTLDGKIAAPEDNSGWITSEQARAHVQTLRHESDAILTGIGTVLSDDPLLNDRSGLERSRPLLRIVLDSQLRMPLGSRMVASNAGDLLIVTTSAAADDRRRALEEAGVRVLTFDGYAGRTDLRRLVEWLGREWYLSLMIEAGSRVNWAALEAGIVDKIFFYYAPKILGGMQSLPVAGGVGRRRRADAIRFDEVTVHMITDTEFAVEAWTTQSRDRVGSLAQP